MFSSSSSSSSSSNSSSSSTTTTSSYDLKLNVFECSLFVYVLNLNVLCFKFECVMGPRGEVLEREPARLGGRHEVLVSNIDLRTIIMIIVSLITISINNSIN